MPSPTYTVPSSTTALETLCTDFAIGNIFPSFQLSRILPLATVLLLVRGGGPGGLNMGRYSQVAESDKIQAVYLFDLSL